MIKVEDWAEIRRLHRAEGLSIKAIAKRLGIARNTVRSAVRSDEPPTFHRQPRPSTVDAFEPAIRRLLVSDPRMPATVIAERIGWTRGRTILQERVAELRPLFLPPDPSSRTVYEPGELAQWDLWFPAIDIPLGADQTGRPPVIVGVSGYSRFLMARMIPSRETHDVLGGHLACLIELGAVPKLGVYDNEAAIGSRRGGKPVLTDAFQRFRGTLAMNAYLCKPGDPEAKGLVERANGYLETSFLPGRRFESPSDFNRQLAEWLPKANSRVHGTTRCRPIDRLAADRAAMVALPPVLPDTTMRFAVRLGRDYYVRVGTNDYSVHPRAIGRRIEVRVSIDTVTATCGDVVVADHARCWAKHQVITDPEHRVAATVMRAFAAAVVEDDSVEVRDLAVYDRATGVA